MAIIKVIEDTVKTEDVDFQDGRAAAIVTLTDGTEENGMFLCVWNSQKTGRLDRRRP